MKIKGMVSVLLLGMFCFSTALAADFDSVIDTDQPETVMSVDTFDTLNADGELMSIDVAAGSDIFDSHDLSDTDQVLSFAGDADMNTGWLSMTTERPYRAPQSMRASPRHSVTTRQLSGVPRLRL